MKTYQQNVIDAEAKKLRIDNSKDFQTVLNAFNRIIARNTLRGETREAIQGAINMCQYDVAIEL